MFVADQSRGIDILKLEAGAGAEAVTAPASSARHQRLVAKASRGLCADPVLGWMRPLPKR